MLSIESLTSEEFSWEAGMSLAVASKLAYQNASTIQSTVTGEWGLPDVHFFDADDTQVFVARNDQIVLVAFRGTESWGDWITDFNAVTTSRPYGDVHRGFYQAYEVVQDQIKGCLGSGDLGGRKLWITGHSLGGALAVVAAAEFQGTYDLTGLYTYGQPKVGFSSLKDFLNSHYANRFYRFVNDDDIVPQVPPVYSHAGKLIHFDARGDVQAASRGLEAGPAAEMEQPAMTEDQFRELQDQIRAFQASGTKLEADTFDEGTRDLGPGGPVAEARGLFPSFRDHSLVRYIAAIQRQIDNGA